MRRPIQPRSVSFDRVEEQHHFRAIRVGMRDHGNGIAGPVCLRRPPHVGHEADSRGLYYPGADGRRIRRASANGDDDLAMRVLPPVLLDDSPIRGVLGHVEHRAGMVSRGRTRFEPNHQRDGARQQDPAPANGGTLQWFGHLRPRRRTTVAGRLSGRRIESQTWERPRERRAGWLGRRWDRQGSTSSRTRPPASRQRVRPSVD